MKNLEIRKVTPGLWTVH